MVKIMNQRLSGIVLVCLLLFGAVAIQASENGTDSADQQATYLPSFAGENVPQACVAITEPHPLFDPTLLDAPVVAEVRTHGHTDCGEAVALAIEPFDHAVVQAYRWPVAALQTVLEGAGFVVVETHRRAETGRAAQGRRGAEAGRTGRAAKAGAGYSSRA